MDMKKLKIFSLIITAALLIQNITFAVSDTVVSDTDTDWKMQWSWERYEEGFRYFSDIDVSNGLHIMCDADKYAAAKSVMYASKDAGLTQCEKSGEYKLYIRLDSDGNLVPYSADDTESRIVPIYHQGRSNYCAKFNVGETSNDGREIIVSYDYEINCTDNQEWNSPRWELMGFTLRSNVGGKFQVAHNGGSQTFDVSKNTNKHSVKAVIAPTVAEGRFEMTAIEIDGTVTPLTDIYSTASGKTDADCYIDSIRFYMYIGGGNRSVDITNLTITRGFDDIELNTDFEDGAETGSDGIRVYSNVQLKENAFSGKINVYDCDFDDELISDPGLNVSYDSDMNSAAVKFTKLEGGGNYRMEISGVSDIWGHQYTNTLAVSFKTPLETSGEETDVPDGDPGAVDIGVGAISESQGDLVDGRHFCTASYEDGIYTIDIDNKAWYEAEQNTFLRDNFRWYINESGEEIKLGYKDVDWRRMEYKIGISETANTGEPIVVSYDYYADNVRGNYEWGTPYMDIMGMYCYLSTKNSEQSMIKYAVSGSGVLEKKDRQLTSDGWHSVKVVISPVTKDKRCKIEAVVLDGEVTLFDNAYSQSNTYTDETCYLTYVRINTQSYPTESMAAAGNGVIKIRDLNVQRVDSLKGELVVSGGTVNPTEPLKLNFNYPINDEFKNGDIVIYEVSDTGEQKKIDNTLSIVKAYDNKQLRITVGEGGLYYGKNYKLEIAKPLVVNDYIKLTVNEYDIAVQDSPDGMSADIGRNGDKISYSISGGGDAFYIIAASYDEYGAMRGITGCIAQKEGTDIRGKARGNIDIPSIDHSKKVKIYIFTEDGSMRLYKMPVEFDI